jgi:hypothetical protein
MPCASGSSTESRTSRRALTNGTPSTVTRELIARLPASEFPDLALRVLLCYDSADPYAVRATFFLADQGPVSWIFARDLLITGTTDSAGEGDVRISVSRMSRPRSVYLALQTPEGSALIELSLPDVADFLRTTYVLCEPGDEDDHLDLDLAIENLMGR